MEGGVSLPQVEIVKVASSLEHRHDDDDHDDDEDGDDYADQEQTTSSSSEEDKGELVHTVVDYVIKGDLVDELFVELMAYVACPWFIASSSL